MKYCEKCGSILPDGAERCPICKGECRSADDYSVKDNAATENREQSQNTENFASTDSAAESALEKKQQAAEEKALRKQGLAAEKERKKQEAAEIKERKKQELAAKKAEQTNKSQAENAAPATAENSQTNSENTQVSAEIAQANAEPPAEKTAVKAAKKSSAKQNRVKLTGMRAVIRVFLIIECCVAGLFILPLIWILPMASHYLKKVQSGKDVSTGFKICSLLFINVIIGVLMLCDKTGDVAPENTVNAADVKAQSKAAEFTGFEAGSLENSSEDELRKMFEAKQAQAEILEKEREEKAAQTTYTLSKFKTLSFYVSFAAAVIALIATVFVGVSVRCVGQVRSVAPEIFGYFENHNLLYYFKTLSRAEIPDIITEKGFYVVDELITSYRAISVTQTVTAILTVVAVVGFFALAVYQFVKGLKDKKSFGMLGAVGTVVSYFCGALMLKATDYGSVSVIFKEKNAVTATFRLSLGFNTLTIIGITLSLVLLVAAVVLKTLSERAEKPAKVDRFADKWALRAPTMERVLALAVAGIALCIVPLASCLAVGQNSESLVEVYVKNDESGLYEIKNYNSFTADALPLLSSIQKCSLTEEELLYQIETCDVRIAESPNDIDAMIEKDRLLLELSNNRKIMNYSLNYGLTMLYADIALILFCGLFICFALCGRHIHGGDTLAVTGVLPAVCALVNVAVTIFVYTSFAKLEQPVSLIAPFVSAVLAIAAAVGSFFVRYFVLKNKKAEIKK